MAAADVQSRLAASIPSMFMTYWTGNSNTNIDSEAALQPSDNIVEPTYLTPEQPRSRPLLQHSPTSTLPSPSKSYRSVMSGELSNASCISGELSRKNSFMSSNGKSRKHSSRAKTTYNICHPPPKAGATRQKIHVRARPLLQLHKVAASARPMPAFELLPPAIFSPSLSRAISKGFRTRHTLCPADLAIVKADKYHQDEEEKVEDESRDVLALICNGRKKDSKAKIYLDDGSDWDAYALPNGSYEFTSTTENGLEMTARWVLKRPRSGRSQSASDLEVSSPAPSLNKFNFSTISPSSRRHPVIANLSSSTLNIQDSYTMPTSASPSPPVPVTSTVDEGEDVDNASPSTEPIETTLAIRTLITATSIWVALCEGWCPSFKSEDVMVRSPSTKLAPSPSKSTFDPVIKEEVPRRSNSIARILRSAGSLKRRSTASAPGDGASEGAATVTGDSTGPYVTKTRPRAESASTVIHRTTWPRPDMRGRRKNTASSTSTNRFGIDASADVTEEEEGDFDGASPPPVRTPTERETSPIPIVPTITATRAPQAIAKPKPLPSKGASFLISQKQKRESSATSSLSMDTELQAKKRKGRGFRILLCGIV